MDSLSWTEVVGYIGSLLVALALTRNSLLKLRALSLAGSLAFILYGLLIHAVPVIVLNLFTTGTNLFFIVRSLRAREYFSLLDVQAPQSTFLGRFLEYHRADIDRFFPGFRLEDVREPMVIFVLRNVLPVGLVILESVSEDTLEVRLDYVTPQYRDLKTAEFFFRTWRPPLDRGAVRHMVARSAVPAHTRYLKRAGFVAFPEQGPEWFRRAVEPPTAEA